METGSRRINWGSLILGVLFIIVSLLAFRDPKGNLEALVIVFGIFAIVKGVFELIIRSQTKDFAGSKMIFPLVMGVLDILIGIFFLFNNFAGIITLAYMFSIWFIVDSVMGLFSGNLARQISPGYFWFSLVVNVIGLILGIYLLFNPLAALLTLSFLVGFYFMLFGIMRIVYAFG